MKNIAIIGGAGYTGGELLRILLNHSQVNIAWVHSRSNANQFLYKVHEDLHGETNLQFTDTINFDNIDVVFLCLGHGESKKLLQEIQVPTAVKIIDLANDFRLAKDANFINRQFIYGLPEINKQQITTATAIANPGCFATAIQLGLLPLAKAGLLQDVYTTAITGSTGAGQGLSATSHFSWRASNVQAYKTLTHQHVPEIMQSLNLVKPTNSQPYNEVSFVPWRGNFTRGIYASSQFNCSAELHEVLDIYKTFYATAPFVVVSDKPVFLKQAVNTNKCFIYIEKIGEKLVVHSAIDNLIKGAVGQAVQNMNLMFAFNETEGLKLKSSGF